MSTNATPPPVGTIMRWHDFCTEVLVSTTEYVVTRDEGRRLYALQHIDGEWRDNTGDAWEVEERGPAGDGTATTAPPVGASALGALTDRLTELEGVVEDLNRRLCDADDSPAPGSDLPTLPVGAVLEWGWPYVARTVIGAAPGFVLAVTADGDKHAMAWINGGWRTASYGRVDVSSDSPAWEVQP